MRFRLGWGTKRLLSFQAKDGRKLKQNLLYFIFTQTLIPESLSEQLSFKPEKRRPAVARTSNRKKRCKRMPRLRTGVASSTKRQADKNPVPPELLSRLPSALQEINRRIMGQNFLWLALQLDWKRILSELYRNSVISTSKDKLDKHPGSHSWNDVLPVIGSSCIAKEMKAPLKQEELNAFETELR